MKKAEVWYIGYSNEDGDPFKEFVKEPIKEGWNEAYYSSITILWHGEIDIELYNKIFEA